MSLLSLVGSNLSKLMIPSSNIQISVREASKKAGSSTRNRCKNTPGKKRGIKVYDGQRINEGKVLVSQVRLNILPGWNTYMHANCNISSTCHGRVFLTTEKIVPKPEEFEKIPVIKGGGFKDHFLQENCYKLHVHILPDEQHQYFKLVEQI